MRGNMKIVVLVLVIVAAALGACYYFCGLPPMRPPFRENR